MFGGLDILENTGMALIIRIARPPIFQREFDPTALTKK
jgi:hypothetical protein